MTKYFAFVFFAVFSAAAGSLLNSFNIHTTIVDDYGTYVDQALKPFIKLGQYYYLFNPNQQTTWLGAVNYCRTLNANLASIESEQEMQVINSYLISRGTNDYYWIAANDIDEAYKFYWINTGQPMQYARWTHDQPDNKNDNERCVHLWRQGDQYEMNDERCDHKYGFVCRANHPKTVLTTVW